MDARITAVRAAKVLLAALAAYASATHAQIEWPGKPVKFLVPVAPGNTPDIVTRMITERLSSKWGTPVIVENRAGATAARLVTEQVARSSPDGYTFLSTLTTHVQMPSLFNNLSFDPIQDFAPITQTASVDVIFAARADLPARNIKEFIALAKSSPAQLTYGSAGQGSSYHLTGSALSKATGSNLLHVPYKSAAAAMNDMVGGSIDSTFGTLPILMPHVRAGRARPLSIVGSKRSQLLADLPTTGELGMPDIPQWFGILAPRGIPPIIVARVYADVRDILREEPIAQRLVDGGIQAVGSSPEVFAAMLKSSLGGWKKIIDDAGLKAAD